MSGTIIEVIDQRPIIEVAAPGPQGPPGPPGPQGPTGEVTGAAVFSVAGRGGHVTLTKSDVGLSNVDNTADASKPVSTLQAAADTAVANAADADATTKANAARTAAETTAANALAAHVSAADPHTGYQKETEKGQANGYASLDGSGKVPSGQLPALGSSVMKPRWNSSTSSGSTTTVIPLDNTIPQITEGAQVITLAAVTPSSAANTIEVTVSMLISASTLGTFTVALFRDSVANALASTCASLPSGFSKISTVRFLIPSWSGARDLSIRAGPQSGTLFWNRITGGDVFGGVAQTTISAKELEA
jgi:hypothetical protein